MTEELHSTLMSLPHLPGVYQFFDIHNQLLYVGKAKDLKKRVNSYFLSRKDASGKLKMLVSKIHSLKYVVVSSEADAFLLENTLIKQNQPKYNINLKDDKTYPSICVKKEDFPRIFATRQIKKDGSKYFGPYSSAGTVRLLIELVKDLYPFRSCHMNLSQDMVNRKVIKPCLELHLGNCMAPCIGNQTKEEYNESIAMIISVLKGKYQLVKESLSTQMYAAAENYNFELAAKLKTKLGLLKEFQAKSTVVNTSAGSVDVFFLLKEASYYFCNFLRVENGAIIYSHTFEVSAPMEESMPDLLSSVILKIKQKIEVLNSIIIVPFLPSESFEGVEFLVPLRGDRLKLLGLSEKNCRAYIAQHLIQIEHTNPEVLLEQQLLEMQQKLNLKEIPYHLECFDNSNIQGKNPVASCVVFKNAKPSKKDYRHFIIKSLDTPNDFLSMQEILTRRYTRLVREQQPLPQLIVVDGGKGQLSAAYSVLKDLGLSETIPIIGLAKRLEEVFVPNSPTPLYLDKNGFTLKVLMQIRDEAHRFAISFHRKKRSQSMLTHSLDHISGIGKVSVEKLLKKYKTVSRIKQTDFEEIAKLIGPRQATNLFNSDIFTE